MKRAVWFLLLTALAVATPLGCSGCKEKHADKGQHEHGHGGHPEEGEAHRDAGENLVRIDQGMLRDLRVTTAEAESRPAGDTVTVLGELRVNENAYAEVGTPIPARVARVHAAPGDVVRAGQQLADLESADVGKARAAMNTTRARLDLARQTVERKRALAADQIVPQRELQAAEAELAEAQAEHNAAQQSVGALGAARGGGARFVISSPVAGTVIDRTAVLGRMADAEHPLFIVGDLARLWLVVHAFERDALRMRVDTTARVTFPALPGQHFTGKVTLIGSRVDPTSRTVDVRVEVENTSGVLRPGMSASAHVPIGDSNETVVAVPVEAVQRQTQGWCVFIPKEGQQGVFEIRAVGRGRDLGGEVEILSGLRAGERVVVDGAFLLKAEADKARGGGEEHHH
jgi:cobalt-zinc-cadmium efflux system membrane fusion protein